MALEIIGIENEFEMFNESGKVNAAEYVSDIIKLCRKPYFQRFETAFRLWTGGALYTDGDEVEITTPPIEVKKGCATAIVDSLIDNRNNLIRLIDKYNKRSDNRLKLKGYSAHYNFSSWKPEGIIKAIAETAAIPLILLIEQRDSKGIMLREKNYERVEICGDYIVSREQMIAAVAYMLGVVNGVKRGIVLTKGPRCSGLAKALDLNSEDMLIGRNVRQKRRGKTARVRGWKTRSITLQSMLEHYFRVFREDIGKFANDEVELLEEFISGKRKLECDSEYLPEGYVPVGIGSSCKVTGQPLAEAFGRACRGAAIGEIKLVTESMEWDEIRFALDEKHEEDYYRHSNSISVTRDNLIGFYSAIDGNGKAIENLLSKMDSEAKVKMISLIAGNVDVSEFELPSTIGILVRGSRLISSEAKRRIAELMFENNMQSKHLQAVMKALGKPALLDAIRAIRKRSKGRWIQIGGFGTETTANGSYSSLEGLALAGNRLYAANRRRNCINTYEIKGFEGRLLGTSDRQEGGEGKFYGPIVICAGGENIFVADTDNNRICALRERGLGLKHIVSIGKRGEALGEFDAPEGIAVEGKRVYVADTLNNRIQVLEFDGKSFNTLFSYGAKGKGAARFEAPKAVAACENMIYVADCGNNRVVALKDAGQSLKFACALKGEDKEEFCEIGGIACANGKVYAVDSKNRRIFIIGHSEGRLKKEGVFGQRQRWYRSRNEDIDEPEFEMPKGIAVLGERIFVSDANQGIKAIAPFESKIRCLEDIVKKL